MAILLSREAILSAPAATDEVNIPEWGGTVRVRAPSISTRLKMLEAIDANVRAHNAWKEDQEKPEDARETLPRVDIHDQTIINVIFAIVDENDELMFTMEDYPRFAELDFITIAALYRATITLMNRDPLAEKKSSGGAKKRSSSSGSRGISGSR